MIEKYAGKVRKHITTESDHLVPGFGAPDGF